jgi:hypothetical protein
VVIISLFSSLLACQPNPALAQSTQEEGYECAVFSLGPDAIQAPVQTPFPSAPAGRKLPFGWKPVGGGMVPYVKPKVSSSNVTYQAGPGNDVELVYKVEAVTEMMGSVVACRVVP